MFSPTGVDVPFASTSDANGLVHGGAWNHEEVGGRSDVMDRRRSKSRDIAPRIGATNAAGGFSSEKVNATDALRRRGEMDARTRNTQDNVALLIGGAPQRDETLKKNMPTNASREARSGPFLYRTNETCTHFEVEAHLPGGCLVRVLRNPHRRFLTFEG